MSHALGCQPSQLMACAQFGKSSWPLILHNWTFLRPEHKLLKLVNLTHACVTGACLAQQNRITNSRCPLARLRLTNDACLTGAAVKKQVKVQGARCKVQGARCRKSVDSKTLKHGFRDSRCSQREEAHSECRRFRPLFAVPDSMSTRRGRDDQVATSLTTSGHSQQDRTKVFGRHTNTSSEQGHNP